MMRNRGQDQQEGEPEKKAKDEEWRRIELHDARTRTRTGKVKKWVEENEKNNLAGRGQSLPKGHGRKGKIQGKERSGQREGKGGKRENDLLS